MTAIKPAQVGADRKRRKFLEVRTLGIVLTLIVLFVVLSVSSPAFFTVQNLANIVQQSAPLGIAACGLTVVFIGRGFDLSIGATFGLAGVVAAFVTLNSTATVGFIAAVVCGALVGGVNGFLATVGRIDALVATLATSVIVTGIALGLSDGRLISVRDDAFTALGRGETLGIQNSVLLFVLVIVVLSFAMHQTTWGRYIYSVGGNDEAAALSGLRVNGLRASTYVIAGALAALAGAIVASRVSTGQADAGGLPFVMDIFTAVVIGGTSILGGSGSIWRTVVGVFVLALIQNGFNLLGVEITYQRVIFGLLLLAAVALDAWGRRAR